MSEEFNPTWYDPGTKSHYHFNDEGIFVDDQGNTVKKGFLNNDDFADWINDYGAYMMKQNNLVELCFPDSGVPIYHSPGALNSPKKLLVIIQGTGRVRAGIWSIGVCAYHGLKAGSALSAIIEAKARNMEIIVLNPNDPRSGLLKERYNSNIGMISHTLAVFEDYIIPAKPENVYIICHSMGGECALQIIRDFAEWSIRNIRAMAMTDACESRARSKSFTLKKWLFGHAINWICSNEEKNQNLGEGSSSMHRSAGTNDHPLSTVRSWQYIWEFFDDKGARNDEFEDLDIQNYIGEDPEDDEYVDNKCRIA